MAERVIDTLITRFLFKADSRALDGLQQKVDRVRSRINAASTGITIAGAAITGAGAAVGRTILQFETEMNNLRAVVNGTEEDMEALRGQAEQLGKTTAFSASQVAEAQTELARKGFSTAQILGALPGVLKAAIAGQVELSEATEIVTGTLNAYGLESSDSTRIADIFAAAASNSATDFKKLGIAFQQSAPLAAKMGIEIEELGAMLGVLQDRNIRAEASGTAVRNIMLRLRNPTKEVTETLKELGVDYGQISDLLNQGRLADAIQLIGDAGLDVASSGKIFGTEAAAMGVILAGAGEDTERLEKALRDSAGQSGRMADTQMEGLPGAVKELRSAFEAAQLAIGQAGLTGGLERLADRARDILIWFTDLDRGTRRLVAGALLAGPGLLALGAVLRGISFALLGLVPAVQAVGLVLGALATPLALIAAAAAGAAYVIYRNWDRVGAFFRGVWEQIKAAFPGAGAFFENLWREISLPVAGIFDWLRDAWVAALGWLSGPGENESPLDWLARPVHGLFDWIPVAWNAALQWIAEPVTGVWHWLRSGAPGTFDWVRGQWTTAVDWVRQPIPDIFEWLKTAWNEGLQWIAEPVTAVWAWIRSGTPGIFGWLSDQWNAALDGPNWASMLFKALRDAIAGTKFGEIGTTIGGAVGGALVTAASGLTDFVTKLKAAVEGIDFFGIGADIGKFIGEALVFRLAGLTNFISELATTVAGLDFNAVGADIGDGIGTIVVATIAALTGLLAGLTTTIEGFNFTTIGADIGTAIRVALVAAATTMTGFLSGMAAKIKTINFGSIGKTIGQFIRAAFVAAIDLVGALFTGLDADADSAKWVQLGTKLGKAILDAMAAVLLGFGDIAQGVFDGVIGEKTAEGFKSAYQQNQERLERERAERRAAQEDSEPGFFGRLLDFGGPDPTPALAASGAVANTSVSQERSTSLNIERLEVNVPNGDPESIVRGIEGAWREELHNTAEDFDTGQAR